MSITNAVLLLVAVAVASAEQHNITDTCTGQPQKTVYYHKNDTFMIMNDCAKSDVVYTFTIADEMYTAFQVQLISDENTINRDGVTLTIKQTVYENGTDDTFLTCTNGNGTTCAPIYTTEGVKTFTYRAMTISLTIDAKAMMTEILVTPVSTNTTKDVDLSASDKSQTVTPVKYEYTQQLFKMTAKPNDKSYTYVNKFTVDADNCYLNEGKATFTMYNSTSNGEMGTTVIENYACNKTDTEFMGVVWLEYKRVDVPFNEPTVTGMTTTIATPVPTTTTTTTAHPKSGTRCGLSFVALLVVVYQVVMNTF